MLFQTVRAIRRNSRAKIYARKAVTRALFRNEDDPKEMSPGAAFVIPRYANFVKRSGTLKPHKRQRFRDYEDRSPSDQAKVPSDQAKGSSDQAKG